MKPGMLIPTAAWIILTAVCLVCIVNGLKATLKMAGWERNSSRKILSRTIIFILLWTGLLLFLAYKNFFADFSFFPPRPALAILIPLPVILIIAFSKKGTQLLKVIPPHWLIVMQSFRIAVELLLLLAFIKGKLPVQMTFEGWNFDIVTGLLALLVTFLLTRKKINRSLLILIFNIAGLLLLLNILVIAVLSMPTPIRYFMNEPANTLVAKFPFILLPGVLVPLAYGLHILSLRQLYLSKKNSINEK